MVTIAVTVGNHVQSKQKLQDMICDKRISLEILKIQKAMPIQSCEDIFNHLPSHCTENRVRTVEDLREFLSMYADFHHDIQHLNIHATVNEEDFIIMAPADLIKEGEGVIDI